MWVKQAPHGRPPPPLSTPCRGQSFTAVACHKNVAKMLLSSANLLLPLLLLLFFFMLSVALSEVHCRQQIREPISKMLTPSIGQLNSFFIHLTLRLCSMPDAESDSQSGHSWQPCWNRVTYCVALHSTSDSTSLASNFQLNEFTLTKYLFVWYFYFPHWSRIQSHLWFEFADDKRIMDLRGKLIEFVCMAMNNY